MIPQLRDLEARFHNQLLVIGVHSAKYTMEGRDAHLREAVLRLDIEHPVVNDHEMRGWNEYAVRAWPTLMFVGPDGRVIGKHEGEFDPEAMENAVRQMIDEASASGAMDERPFELLARPQVDTGVLAYPTDVQIAEDRVYIADTANHRIVIADLGGRIDQVIGNGKPGFRDDVGEGASFHAPHGLDLHNGTLFVADTGNHAIRAVDLASSSVRTQAGTGEIARSYGSGGEANETALRSPWDVVVSGETLFISMAGNHQLWMLRLDGNHIRRFAGTGHEGKRDDSVPRAWLAQPSGIARYRDQLLFADAETSSVRISGTTADGDVTTLVGRDLFDWGDVDGPLEDGLLQHTTGVAFDEDTGLIYVSDTYNNKIKRIDIGQGVIHTVAGTGDPAHANGPVNVAAFFEPHGLSIHDGKLYVADTNNHAIRVIDLECGSVSTLDVSD